MNVLLSLPNHWKLMFWLRSCGSAPFQRPCESSGPIYARLMRRDAILFQGERVYGPAWAGQMTSARSFFSRCCNYILISTLIHSGKT